MSGPAEGEAAPAFALPDGEGRLHRLTDYRGRWLLLYFYPRDFTPGCTREACALRDAWPELGAAVLGVSLDPPARHRRFARRLGLPFPLLSDDGTTAAAYGALWRLGPWRLARRRSFLIDPEGRIARIYERPRPRRHGREVARDLARLTPRVSPPSGSR